MSGRCGIKCCTLADGTHDTIDYTRGLIQAASRHKAVEIAWHDLGLETIWWLPSTRRSYCIALAHPPLYWGMPTVS